MWHLQYITKEENRASRGKQRNCSEVSSCRPSRSPVCYHRNTPGETESVEFFSWSWFKWLFPLYSSNTWRTNMNMCSYYRQLHIMSELGPLNPNKWVHIHKQMQVLHSKLELLSHTPGRSSAWPPFTENDTSRLRLCPDRKETAGRTSEGQGRDAGEDKSVLLVFFLFPNRRGPAPCPKTSTSVLQGIRVHHSFTASRLVLWLLKQPHPHKRRKYQLPITIPGLWGHPWFIPSSSPLP